MDWTRKEGEVISSCKKKNNRITEKPNQTKIQKKTPKPEKNPQQNNKPHEKNPTLKFTFLFVAQINELMNLRCFNTLGSLLR